MASWSWYGRETSKDGRALTPVLSVFGFPVASFIHVAALSRLCISPILKPQGLVAFGLLTCQIQDTTSAVRYFPNVCNVYCIYETTSV